MRLLQNWKPLLSVSASYVGQKLWQLNQRGRLLYLEIKFLLRVHNTFIVGLVLGDDYWLLKCSLEILRANGYASLISSMPLLGMAANGRAGAS